MGASLSCCGTTLSSHIRQKRSVVFCGSVLPPCWYISAGMESAPGAFPVDSCLIDFLTSSSLGGLSQLVAGGQ